MSSKKTHNLAVKVGTYQKDGQEKGKYVNVGSLMSNDDGGMFILMERTFNPAGCPNPDNKESVLVSAFPVDNQGQQGGQSQGQGGQSYGNNNGGQSYGNSGQSAASGQGYQQNNGQQSGQQGNNGIPF